MTTPLPPEDVDAARRELRGLLDEVRLALAHPAVHVANESPEAVAVGVEALREMLNAEGPAAHTLALPPGACVDLAPTALRAKLERLCALLGLSERERAFVGAALDDASDFDLWAVLADYLLDQGRDGAAEKMRQVSDRHRPE